MTVVFANEPNRELVERALERFVAEVAKSRREQAATTRKDDLEPIESENGPQNRI